MATLIRGHTYQTNDLVNAENLDRLVRNAQVAGITMDDLGSGLAWSSVYTAPTNPPYGWITSVYEHGYLSSGPTYCHYHTLIRLPCDAAGTNTSFSDVALFSPDRIESKRFVYLAYNFLAWGGPARFAYLETTGYTLCTLGKDNRTYNNFGLYLWNVSTGSTEGTWPLNFNNHRFVLKGFATAYLKLAGASHLSILPHFYSHFTSDLNWSYAAGTEYDPVFLFALTNKLSFSVDLFDAVYLLGGPMWRS